MNSRPNGATRQGPAAPALADDLLEGAGQIAEFIYGADTPITRRKVFYLASEAPPADRPPIFRLGRVKLALRKSRFLAWVEQRERHGAEPAEAA